MKHLTIRPLESRDVDPISAAFSGLGWNKPSSQYERYLSEQQRGIRTVFIAFVGGDFNVLPRFRRRGIGSRLMDEAERKVSERSGVAGIGVGLSPDYGAAQRLYVLCGYVWDGKGLRSNGSPVRPGDEIAINDGLVLYLTKALPSGRLRGERKA